MLMTNGFFLSVLEAKQKKFHIQEIGFTRKFSYLGILLVFSKCLDMQPSYHKECHRSHHRAMFFHQFLPFLSRVFITTIISFFPLLQNVRGKSPHREAKRNFSIQVNVLKILVDFAAMSQCLKFTKIISFEFSCQN